MKRYLAFAVASAAVIGGMLVVMTIVFPLNEMRRAFTVAAAIALGVQWVAFFIARAMAKENVIAGWGIGVVLRFGALVAFAFMAPKLALPLGTALLSLAVFLFVSTLIEPFFLRP